MEKQEEKQPETQDEKLEETTGESTETQSASAEETPSENGGVAAGDETPVVAVEDDMKWYVVHTYSGYEQKAKLALKERVRQYKMEKMFGECLIPSENVIELVRGEKKTTSRKFFPGYMLVKMILNDATWHLVKSTPKITGFVGNALTPPAVPEEEVSRITSQMAEGSLKPRPKVQFEEGENVRVVDGPFVNFNGVVEEVKPDKGKLRVLVSIFGRSTPVELDFVQVEKN
jgi:transcriptional antiterminator NusG